jgi:hypothetical protein
MQAAKTVLVDEHQAITRVIGSACMCSNMFILVLATQVIRSENRQMAHN